MLRWWYMFLAAGLGAPYLLCCPGNSLLDAKERDSRAANLGRGVEDDEELYSNAENRTKVIAFLEKKLRNALKWDKGTGCDIPELDPFSTDTAWTYKKLKPLVCKGRDWVKCYHSKCRVIDEIRKTVKDIKCEYMDIIYVDDFNYDMGKVTAAKDGEYELSASDHVSVSCTGTLQTSRMRPAAEILRRRTDPSRPYVIRHLPSRPAAQSRLCDTKTCKQVKWSGNTLGFRPVSVPSVSTEQPLNVLILAFASASRTGFISLMPKTWMVIVEELNAVVMEGYNVLGDGTPFALFPILTGKTELELPDVRKSEANDRTMDDFPFIFKKLKKEGYRTAYFEDMGLRGTFQFRFNGFKRQPADHYLRAFYNANSHLFKGWNYCFGDTPQFRMMLNITEQFLELEGKRFIFTFISDITRNDLNNMQLADKDTAAFLMRQLKRTEDTLIVIMGDHGPRYAKVRNKHSYRGKLDERLPLLAIRLPSRLTRALPDAQSALEANARALTTPHDLHATILDALGMRRHWNPYKVQGADLKRGLTMLEPIPSSRSCSEAGIETHWCTCLVWQQVSIYNPLHDMAAQTLIDYINFILKDAGSRCAPRTIEDVMWVLRQNANSSLLSFNSGIEYDSYLGRFGTKAEMTSVNYQISIEANPGGAVFEASLIYNVEKDKFYVHARDISRVNAYRGESDCILDSHPHLAPYCYCKR